MTPRARCIGWALALLAGCHGTDRLPTPELGPSDSALLVLVQNEAVPLVHALPAGARSLPTFRREGPVQLYALRYSCGLDVLGLDPGEQTLEPSLRDTLDLPAPAEALTFDVGADERWRAAPLPETVQEALRRLDLPPGNQCRTRKATFTKEEVQLAVPDTDKIVESTLAIPLDDQSTLVGALFRDDLARTTTVGYGAYRVRGDAVTVEPTVNALGPVLAAAARDDGDLYLMGPEDLFLGHPDRGFTVVTSTAFARLPRRMTLSGSPSGDELYLAVSADLDGIPGTVGSRRWLYALSEEGWRRVARADVDDDKTSREDVAWIGPGRAVAVGISASSGELLRIEDGVVRRETLGSALSHAQRLPDGRPLVGSRGGQAWAFEGAGWVALRRGGGLPIAHVVPLGEDGYAFFRSTLGAFDVSQTFDALGDCERTPLGTSFITSLATLAADRWLGFLYSIRPASLRVARVTLTGGPYPVCPAE